MGRNLFPLLALLAGCLAEVARHSVPTTLEPGSGPDLRIEGERTLRLPNGQRPILRDGSRWRAAGRVAEGAVYRPVDGALAVQARHQHEGWLVVRDGILVGLYLPVESSFLPLESPVPLKGRSP